MSPVKSFQFIAAPFTPFDQENEVRLDTIPNYFRHLRDQGVQGAFLCGTTGEAPSLTVAERLRLAEAWMQARGSHTDFRLFVHAGHECMAQARMIAHHAASIGADAVSVLAPTFFTPRMLDATVDHTAQVADAANGVLFYYHQLPFFTAMNLSTVRFLELAHKVIPNLAGLKLTHSDLGEYHDCMADFGG